jgi:hypothetical protein
MTKHLRASLVVNQWHGEVRREEICNNNPGTYQHQTSVGGKGGQEHHTRSAHVGISAQMPSKCIKEDYIKGARVSGVGCMECMMNLFVSHTQLVG